MSAGELAAPSDDHRNGEDAEIDCGVHPLRGRIIRAVSDNREVGVRTRRADDRHQEGYGSGGQQQALMTRHRFPFSLALHL